ncbi:MAG: hypothetical protein M3317_13820 [Actinomycetota bacterium]|nr:hypothetical protein [Actinomycetota bacterium]
MQTLGPVLSGVPPVQKHDVSASKGVPQERSGDALHVILWQDWETLGEAREGGGDTQ